MRGDDIQQNAMFSYLSPEQRVPQDHPLRKLRPLVDQVLKKLSLHVKRDREKHQGESPLIGVEL
jgi:hypothetical protein